MCVCVCVCVFVCVYILNSCVSRHSYILCLPPPPPLQVPVTEADSPLHDTLTGPRAGGEED